MRLIFYTNTLVSRLLFSKSIPAQAFSKGLRMGQILMSEDTLSELTDVLSRRKFETYISLEARQQFIRRLGRIVEIIPIIKVVRQCRDPKDDKLLELAVNGRADFLITGDADLLAIGEFSKTKIVTPIEFLGHV